jgi:hypothetical protein
VQIVRRQRGLGFFTFLLVGAAVVFLGLLGFRLVPLYVEYFAIKKVMNQVVLSAADRSPIELRRDFDLKASADYVTSLRGGDLDITKEGGQVVISAAYSAKVPLGGNLSLLVEFTPSTRR